MTDAVDTNEPPGFRLKVDNKLFRCGHTYVDPRKTRNTKCRSDRFDEIDSGAVDFVAFACLACGATHSMPRRSVKVLDPPRNDWRAGRLGLRPRP